MAAAPETAIRAVTLNGPNAVSAATPLKAEDPVNEYVEDMPEVKTYINEKIKIDEIIFSNMSIKENVQLVKESLKNSFFMV